ncbi:MAG: DNA starvation/stationary phase protection protein [Polyangiaceae bacterium]
MTTGAQKKQPKVLEAQPILGQRGKVIQPFGTLVNYPIGLDEATRAESAEALNRVLVETMTLRDLYKKAHWQVTGPTFYMLHLLFDEHHKEQASLIDMVGERIQTLGALAIAMSADVAERSRIERPPACREQVPVMLSRLIEAHGKVIEEARKATRIAQKNGDESTANLLTSFILPQNEKQVWFLAPHLVETPLVRAHD